MTRGELALACCYERTLYYGEAPVKVIQMPFLNSKSNAVVVRSAINPKGRQWRADFDELSAIPRKDLSPKPPQKLKESQIHEQYRLLSSSQRCRIIAIHRACYNAAWALFSNTPHTPEVIAGVEALRSVMDVAIEAIVHESES